MKPIDLGMSYSDKMPQSLMKDDIEEEYFPSFHYEGPTDLDLPHEGVMTVRFRKTSSGMSERDGRTQYNCTVEVHKILDVKERDDEAPTRKHRGAEEALDALLVMKMKEKSDY